MQNFLKVFNVSNKDTRKTLVKLHLHVSLVLTLNRFHLTFGTFFCWVYLLLSTDSILFPVRKTYVPKLFKKMLRLELERNSHCYYGVLLGNLGIAFKFCS